MNKNNYLQVYLDECKYDIKKNKMTRFTDVQLYLNDSLDSGDSNSE